LTLTVTGTSISDDTTRTTSDTENIVFARSLLRLARRRRATTVSQSTGTITTRTSP
jgi:hypothetical protein